MRHRILAAILDFVVETEKRKKNPQPNSSGPVCILQIFENNLSRGFQVRAEKMAAADSSKTISLHYHMYSGCRFNYDGCDLKSIPLSGTVGYLISLKRRILHICQISPKS